MTAVGVLLGTAAYMAPEQARGKAVDKRADLWALGVVLFEMLTGIRLFDGATIADTLALVLAKEPDWAALPPDTPPALRRLLRRCLEKDPKRRLADAADARLEMDDSGNTSTETLEQPVRRSQLRASNFGARLGWTAVAATVLVATSLAGLGVLHLFEAPVVAPRPFKLEVLPPAGTVWSPSPVALHGAVCDLTRRIALGGRRGKAKRIGARLDSPS